MPDMYMDVDTALSEVPVNLLPLLDDTDFKTRETAIAYNASGMDLVWNFATTGGSQTQTAVTPTTGGNYDWTHQGDGMYSIEIPASGGASINNDTEGFGWFTGVVTGVLPWRGPVICFRAAALNDALVDGGDLLDVNVTQLAGTAQTARDIGASVLLSSGTGTGQLDFTSGVVKANLAQILGTALTETAGQIAAAFKKFFNVATPTGTINSLPDAVPGAAGGLLVDDVWTDVRAAKLDNLDAAMSSRSTLDAAGVRSAVGLASANLDTQLDAIPTAAEIAFAVGEEPPSAHGTLDSIGYHIDRISDVEDDTSNIQFRIGAFSGINNNTIYDWMRRMFRKDLAAASDIGGTYDPATDSLEAHTDVGVALNDVATTEPTSVPAATASVRAKINYVFMKLRNKGTSTSTQEKTYADDGTTVVATASIADDGTTFTKGEDA